MTQDDEYGDYVLYSDYEALEKRAGKLEVDARRYRWLRDICHLASTHIDMHVVDLDRWGDINNLYRNEELDIAIDAAIAAEGN